MKTLTGNIQFNFKKSVFKFQNSSLMEIVQKIKFRVFDGVVLEKKFAAYLAEFKQLEDHKPVTRFLFLFLFKCTFF